MQRWKKFWRLRKQEDAVKLMLLFFAIGIVCLGNAIYQGIRVYRQMQSPVEYILLANAQNKTTDSQINTLQKINYVTAVCHQKETFITAKAKGKESTFTCMELSDEYIEKVYGIREVGAMKTFYMNGKAYNRLKQELDGTDAEASRVGSAGKEEMQIRYLMEQERAEQETIPKEKVAKVVLIRRNMSQEEPYVFSRESIANKTSQIRVCVEHQELEGATRKRLENTGLTLEYTQTVREAEYKQELKIVHLTYRLLAGVLCLVCVWSLWLIWRKKKNSDRDGSVWKRDNK